MADPTWDESEPVEDIPTWEESEEVGGTASQLRTPSSISAGAGIVGAASKALDAPSRFIRGGVSRLQGYDDTPEWSTILGRAGVPERKSIPNPIATNPFDPESKLSPAQIGGAALGVAADPLTYVGGVLPAKAGANIGKGVEKGRAALSSYLKNLAEERAAKTAFGPYIGIYRQEVGTTAKGMPDLAKAQRKIRDAGRLVLDNNMIGRLSKTEGVQQAAFPKWEKSGETIGNVIKSLDEVGAQISGDDIANEMIKYADTFPDESSPSRALIEQIKAEAEGYRGKTIPPSRAQKLKESYQYKETDSSSFKSNKDVVNKFKEIVSDSIDRAAETQSARLLQSTDPQMKATGELLASYPQAKEEYGTFKNIATAGTNEWLMSLKNRVNSPTDYMVGSAGGIAGGPVVGLTAGLAHKVARERGSAFVARAADDLRKIISAKPQFFSDYGQVLGKAAAAGNTSLISTHHLLMQSDPKYRNAFTNAATQDVPTWEESE